MNLPGGKYDGHNIRWEPFATSTPLKPITINLEAKSGACPVRTAVTQKELDVSKIFRKKQSVTGKIRITGKNRSRAYFDLSSSSDDDDDDPSMDKNRPVIKIGTESIDKVKLVVVNGKCDLKVTKNSPRIKKKSNDAKCQNTQLKPENKAEKRSTTSNSDVENTDIGGNNEVCLPATVNNFRPENKKPLQSSEFFQNSKKESVNKLKDNKSVPKVRENSKTRKSTERLLKRKDAENRNTINIKKRKQAETVLTEKEKILKRTGKRTNSSHQLFTDSTQEELINTLCLTTPEADELIMIVDSLRVTQKSAIVKPVNSKESEMVKENSDDVENQKRPKRTRQAPKKYWLVENEPLKEKEKIKRLPRRKPSQCKSVPTVSTQLLDAGAAKNFNKTQTVCGSKELPVGVNNSRKQRVKNPATAPGTKRQSGLSMKKSEVPVMTTAPENTSEQPVYLPLNEVSYVENEFGHEVGQMCNMKNFKCGIFKLKPGSNVTWEKSLRSNYMGGVVVKGEIKMTIGGKGRILREGDMAFVPPLSECEATNTGGCESIYYYWSGKFNK